MIRRKEKGIERTRKKIKNTYNNRKKEACKYKIGDLVVIRTTRFKAWLKLYLKY